MNLVRTLFLLAFIHAVVGFPNWRGKMPQAAFDDLIRWGTYKSHRIHSITEKTEPFDSLVLSMLVGNDLSTKHYHNIIQNVEDFQSFYNPKTKLFYRYHNGFTYANQVLDDPYTKINLTNTFYKTSATAQKQAWGTLTDVFPYKDSKDEYITLFYSIALESYFNNGTRYLEFDPQNNVIKVHQPSSLSELTGETISYIKYFFYKDGVPVANPEGIEVHFKGFAGLNQSKCWQVAERINDSLIYDSSKKYMILPNTVDKDVQHTYLATLQFKIRTKDRYQILFNYDSASQPNQPDWKTLQLYFRAQEAEFVTAFNLAYPGVPKTYQPLTQYAISNLLGGILYYYGPITIEEDPTPQPPHALFTATPTRNFYERGFLWDEGFHNLMICRWNAYLCSKTISSWFGTQYKTGWIAREQVRSDELKIFVNASFIPQSNVEGNPPTLMLALEYLTSDPKVDASIKTHIYTQLKDKMYKWWQWFYVYQTAPGDKNMFLWTSKEYEGRTDYYGSGLDDYPRFDDGFISKYHLDLQVWEMMFVDVMANVSNRAQDKANATFFSNLLGTLKTNLELFHDPKVHLYKDIFQPNDTKNHTSIPSVHVGYISLLPMIFGYMKNGSPEFEATLDLIDQKIPGVMWTRFGITSLSQKDPAFQGNENYWTGPIWINFHYLTLRALKRFYWSNPRVPDIYNSIRTAIIGTVNNAYVNTGYIWEIYNLTSGEGMRSHPFTGWSTLVTLIITEQY